MTRPTPKGGEKTVSNTPQKDTGKSTNKITLLIAAIAIIGGFIAAFGTFGSTSTILFTPNVIVSFGTGQVDVYVEVPGPPGMGYYYYYYTTTPTPLKVIVVLEKIVGGNPVTERTSIASLTAYTSNNWADIKFMGLDPGVYRVKVYFWNDLLKNLGSSPWKPYAEPTEQTGGVS